MRKIFLYIPFIFAVLVSCTNDKTTQNSNGEKPPNLEALTFITEPSENQRVMITLSNLEGPYTFVRTDTNLGNEQRVASYGPITEGDFRELLESVSKIKEFTEYQEPPGNSPMNLQANYLISIMIFSNKEPITYLIPKADASDDLTNWVDQIQKLASKK